MKKHYLQMDGLRALAAMAVVMIHVTAGAAGMIPVACNQLARFSVPLFILLSGFGHGGDDQDLSAPLNLFIRRMKRILPPYLCWSVLYLLIEAAFGAPHPRPVWDVLTGGAYMHLYFIFALVQFEILYVPLYRAVQKAPNLTLLLSAVITMSMQVLICGQMQGLWQLPQIPIPYTRTFVPFLLFYVAGLWLRRRDRLPQQGSWLLLVGAVVFWLASAALVLLTVKRFPALRSLSLRPDLTLYVFTSWLLLWTLFSLPHHLPRPVRVVSRLSFALYLSHPLIMRLWNEWTVRQDPVIYLKLWQSYLMTFIGGLVIAFVLSRLPFGQLLGGAPRKKTEITEGRNGEKT